MLAGTGASDDRFLMETGTNGMRVKKCRNSPIFSSHEK
jgi:hypothetical protein